MVRIRPASSGAARALEALLPLLDGTRTPAELFAALAKDGIGEATARALLAHLEDKRLLEHVEGDRAPFGAAPLEPQLEFFSRFDTDGGRALQRKLEPVRVAVIGGSPLAESVSRQLGDSGVGEVVALRPAGPAADTRRSEARGAPPRVSSWELDRARIWPPAGDPARDPGRAPDLLVLTLDAHDPDLTDAVERFAFASGAPWCLVQIASPREARVGPLFVPRESACHACMEGRLLSNFKFPAEYLAFRDHLAAQRAPAAPVGGLIAQYELLASVAVIEVIKFLTEYAVPQLVGRFLTINTVTWVTELHDVLRLPQCRCRRGEPTLFPWKEANYAKRQGPRS